ncbi:DUF4136 domain-containing protein [Roseivirga echinicomitans]|uniref:DUF4136 domain-containing protein n=1 Tax=Roseivirga echinicomitans TaxID=296218 RepID=A0A150X326_9BACT|nr:DUF4136 domain-containing protein [Roseivirga echinicomitans]KYG73107.1 hypothetical protein AWN68_10490 [Roseivirga echinicomitans]
MKKLLPLFLLCLLALSCSERLYVTTDQEKGTDFTQYKSFAWAEEQEKPGKSNPMFDNELNRKRIMEAVEVEMKVLGFEKTDDAPDLLVDFHIVIDQKVNNMTHNDYPYDVRYWSGYQVETYTFNQGSIVIHMIDNKKELLVWQGIGSKTLNDVPPKDAEERIKKGVKAIMAKFPTTKK